MHCLRLLFCFTLFFSGAVVFCQNDIAKGETVARKTVLLK